MNRLFPVRKICNGLYQIIYKGRIFQVEDHHKASDGEGARGWMAYEMDQFGGREYLNDYTTKRAAVARTIAAVDEGY